ncbi:SpaA isopeptide-forming pilin-related protein [uncultured Anaerococcus sp.]|uniref:SpaA isopeptide-forming pilin-related protein n=1 Tax=uncultured Anaerococcus sp. TaxID=293428 RepID=UPI0025D20A1D|nr:SpaA isopeptide-forming pilin-related protein [uncultured Anaerococcus sp.]
MEFTNKFKLDSNIKINPGDYFVMNVSKNTDIYGIFTSEITNLDIFADGIGTIAKADYDRKAGKITYTFTKYADTYDLIEFSNKISSFINLDKVRVSDTVRRKQKVGFGMGDDTSQYKDIRVVYDLDYGEDYDIYGNGLNQVSKIVKYNPDTGEFVHYFYINRKRANSTGVITLEYDSKQNLENVNVSASRLIDNQNVQDGMPESFGVDESSNNLSRFQTLRRENYLPKGNDITLYFNQGLGNIDSYLVKVTGRVADEDKSSYEAEAKLIKYYPNGEYFGVRRYDEVYPFLNETTAKAELSITAVNPSNIIKFKKINSADEALEGATFQLYKKNREGKWNSYEQPITTNKDGLVEYSKLPKGEYQLIETTAPEGYVAPDEPLAEFKVDENGKIFRKETYKDKEGNEQIKYVEEPGIVPIKLVNNKDLEVVFKKVDANDSDQVLEGAEFEVLYKQDKNAEYPEESIKLYKDNAGTIYAFKADENPSGYTEVEGNKITTGKDGLVKFKVRSNGYYALKEVKAPAGYALPSNQDIDTFDVAEGTYESHADGVKYEGTENVTTGTGNEAQRIDNKKVTIPQTGGIGSLIFIVAGLAIMGGAFVAYKKSQAQEA